MTAARPPRAAATPTRWGTFRLWLEFVGLFVVLPLVLGALRWSRRTVPILPVLWLASVPAAVYLARHGWSRRDFFGWQGFGTVWRGVALRVAVAAGLLLALVLALDRTRLFELPRLRPVIWLLVLCVYPLASVYPQGVLYRGLYYARYAALWSRPWQARLAGAVAFSLAHLCFGNGWALGLTLVGGWFFCRTYERTRSLQVANLEHAVCGCLLFTVGLGRYLYHGTLALLAR